MGFLLGVDGGGSTTLAAVVDRKGDVRGVGLGGRGNFQGFSLAGAQAQVQKSIKEALQKASVPEQEIVAAYFGMSGADRPQDFKIVRQLLAPIVPPAARWNFENDALLGLWAATVDGVGVSVVCGTGTNVVGVNREGKKVQIGGMGRLFGDYAGGGYIGEVAVAKAMRGFEGRGEPTSLYGRLSEHYQVEALLDLVDFLYEGKDLDLSSLAPLVMEEAGRGDQVSQAILRETGREMALSALAAIRRLFSKTEEVKVVALGSVFQKAKLPLLYDQFVRTLSRSAYQVRPSVLENEPVMGAIFGAAQEVQWEITDQFKNRLQKTLTAELLINERK